MRTFLFLLGLCLSLFANGQEINADELPTATLEEAGFNQDSIDILLERISVTPKRDFRGLVVIKDDHIVIEEYYNTFWRNHIHDIRSAGKSITAILLGVAIQEGLVESLDQDVYSFFSKEKYPTLHEDYKEIKLIHLLNMMSGLNADTDDWRAPGSAGQWAGNDEWVQYLLGISRVREPGEKWVYADINAVLIGAIIEELSGMSLRDFAKEKVFDPLGIREVYWYTNPSNQTGAAGNLYLSTYDFAKLGLLALNKGKWGDAQIADAAYLTRMIQEESDAIGDWFFLADGYGMFWYKSHRDFGTGNVDYVWASGNGGNHLVIIPDKNMVVALTSGSYGAPYGHGRAYAILGKVLNALE